MKLIQIKEEKEKLLKELLKPSEYNLKEKLKLYYNKSYSIDISTATLEQLKEAYIAIKEKQKVIEEFIYNKEEENNLRLALIDLSIRKEELNNLDIIKTLQQEIEEIESVISKKEKRELLIKKYS